MLLACAALIGSLCVPQEYVPVSAFSSMVNTPSLFDAEQSRRTGIYILAWSSDSFGLASTLGVDRACAQGWCVYYRKHCDPSRHFCEVAQADTVRESDPGRSGLTLYKGFRIEARNQADLRRVMGRLRFVVSIDDRPSDILLPLAAFARNSPDITDFIGCRRSVWVEGCSRPPAPELRRFEHHL